MLALETKQYGGKLLPTRIFEVEGGVFPGETSRSRQRGMKIRTWNVRIFRKWDVGLWTGLSWLRIRTGGGHL